MNDEVNRVGSLIDNDGTTHLADYTYLGNNTVVRIDYPQPQVRLDLWGGTTGTFAGLDRFGRVIDQHWINYNTSTDVDRFQYGYDRDSNRTSRDNTLTTGWDELYSYDNLNRLTTLNRGTIASGTISTSAKEEDWTLDPTGNWNEYVTKTSGTTDLDQTRSHNKANEISSINETTGSSWVDPVEDAVGNMTTMPKPGSPTTNLTAQYDAWNRLVTVASVPYQYDGLGRRIIEGSGSGRLDPYYSKDWQRISWNTTAFGTTITNELVWGIGYIDQLVLRDVNTGTGLQRFYASQDANCSITAIIDTSGAVQERYAYSAYGQPTFMDGAFGSRTNSSCGWDILYGGYRYDISSGLYQVRDRVYQPSLGRFCQRDPIGYLSDMNFYAYAWDRPINVRDPSGREGDEDEVGGEEDSETPLSEISQLAWEQFMEGMVDGLVDANNLSLNDQIALCQAELAPLQEQDDEYVDYLEDLANQMLAIESEMPPWRVFHSVQDFEYQMMLFDLKQQKEIGDIMLTYDIVDYLRQKNREDLDPVKCQCEQLEQEKEDMESAKAQINAEVALERALREAEQEQQQFNQMQN